MKFFDLELLKPYKKKIVLVSGGLDSTYLYIEIKKKYPETTFPLNCWNPYEQNKTLTEISKDPNFILVKPEEPLNYGKYLKEAFLNLPKALKLKQEKHYNKKVFPCCYHIKHKIFVKGFADKDTVIISGIKRRDGSQRSIWLTQMSKGTNPRNIHATTFRESKTTNKHGRTYTRMIPTDGKSTFFHRNCYGQLYCYPYRDYDRRELPEDIIDIIFSEFPYAEHSGCQICPVLVLFKLKNETTRYEKSIDYATKLGIDIEEFL